MRTMEVRCRMKHANDRTNMLLISRVLLGATLLHPQPALATDGSTARRDFQFKALSLHNHGGEIPFSKVPSDEAANAAYPLRLRRTTSVVALNCAVAKNRALTDCEINRSDPDDAKLKAAALELSRGFKITTSYPYSSVTLFLQFPGKVERCLMPFCFPDLITPPSFVSTPH